MHFLPIIAPHAQCYHLEMRDTLKVLLQIRDEGILADFAIGGAIAASFFTPAVATEDLDIFAFGLTQRWETYVKRYA